MLKIIIKSIILVCIVLSVYFIVNPSACSNLINGRAVNVRQELPVQKQDDTHSELFTPTGDQPLRPADKPAKITPVPEQPQTVAASQQAQPTPAQSVVAQTQAAAETTATAVTGITDTQSLPPAQPQAMMQRPQAEVDYAIASRYVELENKYLAQHKDAKNAAKDISYIVMDDFELTPAEWEAFLQRATATNLFETVRQQQK